MFFKLFSLLTNVNASLTINDIDVTMYYVQEFTLLSMYRIYRRKV